MYLATFQLMRTLAILHFKYVIMLRQVFLICCILWVNHYGYAFGALPASIIDLGFRGISNFIIMIKLKVPSQD